MITLKLTRNLFYGSGKSGKIFLNAYSGDLIDQQEIRKPFKIGDRLFVWTKSGFNHCEGLELTEGGTGKQVKLTGATKTFNVLQPVRFEISGSKTVIGKRGIFNRLPVFEATDFFIERFLKGNADSVLFYATVESGLEREENKKQYPLISDLPTSIVKSPTKEKLRKAHTALLNKVKKIGYDTITIKSVDAEDTKGILAFYKWIGVETTNLKKSEYSKKYLGFRDLREVVEQLYRSSEDELYEEIEADATRFNTINKRLQKKYHDKLRAEGLYDLAAKGEAKDEDINRIQASFKKLKSYKEAAYLHHKMYGILPISKDDLLYYYFNLLNDKKAHELIDEINTQIQEFKKSSKKLYAKLYAIEVYYTQVGMMSPNLHKTKAQKVEKSTTSKTEEKAPEEKYIKVSPRQFEGLKEAYSADTIATKDKVRLPYYYDEEFYTVTVVQGNDYLDAYRLVPYAEFKGKSYLYGTEPASFSYHGLRVKYGKSDYVISGPKIIFVNEAQMTVSPEEYNELKALDSSKLLSSNKIKGTTSFVKQRYAIIKEEGKELIGMKVKDPMYFGRTYTYQERKERQGQDDVLSHFMQSVKNGKEELVLTFPLLRIKQQRPPANTNTSSSINLFIYNQNKAQKLRLLKKRRTRMAA